MSQADKDAAKRAAAGESLGAFVTLDINRLEKDELIMLGMEQALAKYVGILRKGVQNAMMRNNPDLLQSLTELEHFMKADLDQIKLHLTKSAMRHKSATIQEIPKDPQ